ncbi:DUF6869 domain-containing protein [Dyella acidisoli]|uniref:DUF6869 domain-containing protein n=2 Tax=Dyella acidisoli TaxID=1867834 RepID=UPI003C2F16BF
MGFLMEPDQRAVSIAIEWIEKWSLANAVNTANSRASGLDNEIPRDDPELCLIAILEILKRIPSDPADHYFQVLAAGPLEDLLVYNGEHCVSQVELAARQSPSFRLLLNGVWSSAIKPRVLDQLSKYRNAPW